MVQEESLSKLWVLSISPIAAVAVANNPKALCESMMGTDNLYRNVAGILFMGTPHRGLELGRIVSKQWSIVSGFGLGSKSPILKQLKPNSEVLQNVNMQFRRVLQRAPIRICSAFETRTKYRSCK
jgi:hypothetical protein